MQVLQEYVPELLLLNGHKCHIRAHVLASGALTVWLSDHCLVLPAVKPFDPECGDDPLVHVTNHAVWKQHQDSHTATASAVPELGASSSAPVPGTQHVPSGDDFDARHSQKCPRIAGTDEPSGTAAVTLEEACQIWLDDDDQLQAQLHELECEVPTQLHLAEAPEALHHAPGASSGGREGKSSSNTVTGHGTNSSADQGGCQVLQQHLRPLSRAALLRRLLMCRIEAIARVRPASSLKPGSRSRCALAQQTHLARLSGNITCGVGHSCVAITGMPSCNAILLLLLCHSLPNVLAISSQ